MKKQLISLTLVGLFVLISILPITNGVEISNNKNLQIFEDKDFIFDRYFSILMNFAHKPSVSCCIIVNDSIAWSKSYGLYDIEKNKHATEDTLYLMGSVSKPVTATALMQLYEQGFFDLDDDVNDYLPFSLRNPKYPHVPITFRMLLSHRSSLSNDNLYWLCLSYLPGDPDIEGYPYPWLKEYLTPNGSAYSPAIWSDSAPGTKFYYTNIGYSLIGYLVELISGQPFNQYCKDHIFTPLEMYNTSFRLKDCNISNIAVPYDYNKGKYFPHPQYGMLLIYPSATLRTSIEEFSHFVIAHMNGGKYKDVRILNESTVDLIHTPNYEPYSGKGNYGFGWFITETFFIKKEIYHIGAWPGAHTYVKIQLDNDIGIIIFTNSLDSELQMTHLETIPFGLIIISLLHKANRLT